jgi:tRNA threonylcarbamoyladenosine biosynthesis protein TsaB
MQCLAIDTSTDYLSLGLVTAAGQWIFHEPVGQQHAERTLPEIARLLAEAGTTLDKLDAIVFGQGPGSFTGLRIACGIAQGLAYSAGLPVIGIPTLDAVAQQAQGQHAKLLVCLDARMQQVYAACYDGNSGMRLTDISVSAPEELSLADGGWYGIGSGFGPYAEQLGATLGAHLEGYDSTLRPHAAAYLQLAASGRYQPAKAEQAELLYVRNKVALTAREQLALRS